MTVTLNSVTAPTPAAQSYVPVVSRTSDAALSSQATALSAESAVVASLGASSGVSVYTPSGLLNSIVQAGTVPAPVQVPAEGSNVDTSQSAQQAQDLAIVNTLASSPQQSGVYTGSGGVAALPPSWADVLKDQPTLAANAISASFNSGIINTIA
jgi:hypothetical protein